MNIQNYDIIGIHGPLDGGKDTIARYIMKKYPNFTNYAMAKPLKEAAQVMFGFSSLQLEDRKLKEEIDPFWGVSPRKVCQLLGTEFGRQMIRDDVWIKRAELQIIKNKELGYKTIITDVRFDNEAEWIRKYPNSLLLYIEAPNLNRDEKYNHASEAGIKFDSQTDIKFVNDKSKGLNWLYQELELLLT